MVQTRQTAYKVGISNILKEEFHKGLGEWDPNYILIKDKKVSRVNVVATVVEKFVDENSGTVEVDDGSGVIKVKVWKDDISILEKVDIGDLILVIGKVRQFNDEIYLTPEVARKLPDISWAKLRKLELEKEHGVAEKEIMVEKVVQETGTEATRKKILGLIGKEEEASYDKVVSDSGLGGEDAKKIIDDLLKEGEIYQSRPGFLKII